MRRLNFTKAVCGPNASTAAPAAASAALAVAVAVAVAAATITALSATPTRAQIYPAKPIVLVVPFAAGGPSDVISRLVGAKMSETLGQQIVIENIAGAGGTIAADRVSKLPADGYTLLVHHIALPLGASLYKNLKYDTATAFDTLGLINTGPYVLTTKLAYKAATPAELFAAFKSGAKVTFGPRRDWIRLPPVRPHADADTRFHGGFRVVSRHRPRTQRCRRRPCRCALRSNDEHVSADHREQDQGVRDHLAAALRDLARRRDDGRARPAGYRSRGVARALCPQGARARGHGQAHHSAPGRARGQDHPRALRGLRYDPCFRPARADRLPIRPSSPPSCNA